MFFLKLLENVLWNLFARLVTWCVKCGGDHIIVKYFNAELHFRGTFEYHGTCNLVYDEPHFSLLFEFFRQISSHAIFETSSINRPTKFRIQALNINKSRMRLIESRLIQNRCEINSSIYHFHVFSSFPSHVFCFLSWFFFPTASFLSSHDSLSFFSSTNILITPTTFSLFKSSPKYVFPSVHAQKRALKKPKENSQDLLNVSLPRAELHQQFWILWLPGVSSLKNPEQLVNNKSSLYWFTSNH